MMSPDEVLKRCDENTIGVVPTLGLTYTLIYEPVEDVVKALDDLQQRQGLDIPVHVDGASGGFIAPFIHPSVVWDFRLPRVKSINASGHKFGLAPLGCGWAIWRDAQDLPEELIFDVKYLGGDMPTFALNFSRPGGQIAAQYYNFVRLGRNGYAKITHGCEEVGIWLAEELNKFDIFEIIYDGRGGIPGCTWTLKNGSHPNFTLYDLSDRLRLRGWQVPGVPHAREPHRPGRPACAGPPRSQPRSRRTPPRRPRARHPPLRKAPFPQIQHARGRRRLPPLKQIAGPPPRTPS